MVAAVSANTRVGLMAGLFAAAMVGLGFAAVPLYDLFCRTTGFGGTTMRISEAEAAQIPLAAGRTMTVRFDSNVSRDLPWQFRAERSRDTVSIGARDMMVFVAKNLATRPITGTASFNVSPSQVGRYFKKVQCFCFTEQSLRPGEEMRMPVVYYIDPAILNDPDAMKVEEITLSYTFFPAQAGLAVDEGKTPL